MQTADCRILRMRIEPQQARWRPPLDCLQGKPSECIIAFSGNTATNRAVMHPHREL